MTLANADDPAIDANLASGKWGLDRASLLVKLRRLDASPELFTEAAERYSLGRLYGLVDRLRDLSAADEQDLFSSTGRVGRGRWFGEQASRTGGGHQTVVNVSDCFTNPSVATPTRHRNTSPGFQPVRSGWRPTTGPPASSTL